MSFDIKLIWPSQKMGGGGGAGGREWLSNRYQVYLVQPENRGMVQQDIKLIWLSQKMWEMTQQ